MLTLNLTINAIAKILSEKLKLLALTSSKIKS